ncbi:immunity protein Tsi6 family protein [Aurantivibrio plasticivorans]
MNLHDFIKSTRAEIEHLNQSTPRYQLMLSISAQLDFILKDLNKDGTIKNLASENDVERIVMGTQAVRELEPSFPDLSDRICKIAYEYKRHYGATCK